MVQKKAGGQFGSFSRLGRDGKFTITAFGRRREQGQTQPYFAGGSRGIKRVDHLLHLVGSHSFPVVFDLDDQTTLRDQFIEVEFD
nr:hypothetical protein [Capillibacterium thermochitinicola]